MKNYKQLRLLAALVMVIPTLFMPTQARVASAQEDTVSSKVVPAIVQLGPLAEVTAKGETKLTPFGWGSGTILNPEGYILTNHHVTDVSPLIDKYKDRPDINIIEGKLAVFITKNADEPPVASYIAEVVADSEDADLSVIQITEDLTGKPVDGKTLHLPSIKLGDSDKLKLGQALHVLGYPGIGGDTITSTPGEVSGFIYEAGTNGRAWIKTSASISGGNSGGAAVDDSGTLVGIPTQLGSGQHNAPSVDCRPYMDSNNDGKIDDKDVCIPIGGFINALRPVNLAKPLIEQALSGLEAEPSATPAPPASPTATAVVTPTITPIITPVITPIVSPEITPSTVLTGTRSPEVTPSAVVTGTTVPEITPGAVVTGTEVPTLPTPTIVATPTTAITPTPQPSAWIDNFIFSAGATDKGQIVQLVKYLPSGSRTLYMFFDYGGFENGKPYAIRVFKDGVEQVDEGPSGSWKWDNAGTLYWGYKDSDLKDGAYKYQVDYDGNPLASASVVIGGADKHEPAISNLDFSGGGVTGHSLPTGITHIDASFDYANMTGDLGWTARWYTYRNDGTRSLIVSRSESGWDQGASGKGHESLDVKAPLAAGRYRLELLINDELAGTNNIYLSGQAPTTPTPGTTPRPSMGFGPISFSTEIDDNGDAVRPSTSFPAGIDELYAVFSYQGMRAGANWSDKWYVNGKQTIDSNNTWKSGVNGSYYLHLTTKPGYVLTQGEYELQLFLEGSLVQSATCTIGGKPTPTPTPETGVILKGRIIDALTGAPIPYAVIGILKEGIAWADYQGTDKEFLEMVTTDRKGVFEFTVPVQRGSSYSIGVEADGYQSIYEDNVDIGRDLPDVYNVEIEMQPLW